MTDPTQNLIRAFGALTEMWSRRHDTISEGISEADGEPFKEPVVVDLRLLADAQSSLLEVIKEQAPELYTQLNSGGVPDAPLPADGGTVVGLDEFRIRSEEEFKDEQVAYLEVLWGVTTFAFNAAIRDLELMRRGRDDGALRPPETYHETLHLILHVRALANDLARMADMEELVRKEDDLKNKEVADVLGA